MTRVLIGSRGPVLTTSSIFFRRRGICPHGGFLGGPPERLATTHAVLLVVAADEHRGKAVLVRDWRAEAAEHRTFGIHNMRSL